MKTHIILTILAAFLPVFPIGAQNRQGSPIGERDKNTLRIMTWNINNGVGTNLETDYHRIAKVIAEVTTDVVALQECDRITADHKSDVPELFVDLMPMHLTFAPTTEKCRRQSGIALLSKEQPIKTKQILLPGPEEKNMLLIAEFDRYVVACTQLSPTESNRSVSTAIIMEQVKDIAKPLFLMGDMNEPHDGKLPKALAPNFTLLNSAGEATSEIGGRALCTDHIYGLKNDSVWTLLAGRVLKEDTSSDHRPMWVDIRLATPRDSVFRTIPYLQDPTGGGITVSWVTRVPVHSWVEYSSDRQTWHRTQTLLDGQVVSNNTIHNVRIDGLKPGVRYWYRVASREVLMYSYCKAFGYTAISEEYSFRLPAPDEKDFSALIFNDMHRNKKTVDSLAKRIADLDYDVVFLNGDIINDPKSEEDAVDFIGYLAEKVDASNHPMIMLRGNHETRNAWSLHLRELLAYPAGKTYGAFTFGDTRFVLLDCGEDKPDSDPEYYGLSDFTQFRLDQTDFLENELSGDPFKHAAKRVLIHHIPIYRDNEGFNPCGDMWRPLLSAARFDIAINGHTHHTAIHRPESLGNAFPIVVGGGSTPEDGTVIVLSRTGQSLTMKMISANGKTLHALNL